MPAPEVRLQGRLTDHAQLRYTGTAKPVTNFRVATNTRRKQGDKWVDADGMFLDCVAWDNLAEHCAELEKGQEVVVTGQLRARDFDGRTVYEISAKHVALSLPLRAARERPQENPDDPWDTQPPEDPWAADANQQPS